MFDFIHFISWSLIGHIITFALLFLLGWHLVDVIVDGFTILRNARLRTVSINDEWTLTKCALVRFLCALLVIGIMVIIYRV